MEKEVIEKPVEVKKELSHNERIDLAVDRLNKNDFNIYFYCPPLNSPSGGVGVLLRLAKNLKDNGLNVKVIYEPRLDQRASIEESNKQKKEVNIFEKLNPTWLDFSISGLELLPLGDKEITFNDKTKIQSLPLSVEPEDFLFIPEGFPDVMQKTMQVSCKRIILAQSWFYILNAMNPGDKWQHYGVQDVVSVSDAITEYLNAVMPGLNIKRLHQGIDRKTFKAPSKLSEKYPMVGFSGARGMESQMKMLSAIKIFYAFYPHLKWIRFIELSGLSRQEFAERLASCAFVLYTDDIAGFGTLPLEAMACGTHVVGWASYGGKEYMNKDNGFWANNSDIFGISELLGIAIEKWLHGEMDTPEIQNSYNKTLNKYTVEKEKEEFFNIINQYKNERINELEGLKK